MIEKYSNYKTINQKWAKEIPAHWKMMRLKLVFGLRKETNNPIVTDNILSLTAKQGVVPYAEKEGTGGNRPKADLTKYNICRDGDLLVNCMNIVSGAAGVSRYTGAISPVYYPLVLRHNDNVWYYHYLFRLITFQRSLIGLGKGILMHESDNGTLTTVRMRISMDYLGNVQLPVPPRFEQDKIVGFLDWKVSEINKLIRIRRKEIKEYRELSEKIICDTLLHGIDKNVNLQNSGVSFIGDVPSHWSVVKIKWLFNETDERNAKQDATLLTFSKKRGLIPFSEASNKMPSASDLSNYKIIHKGQLLENRMQAWHGMFICSDKEGCVSPDYSVFSAVKEMGVNVKFYEYVFRSHVWVEQFANASKGIGTGFNRLYTPQFGAIYTVHPDIQEQNEIVAFLDKQTGIFKRIIEIDEEKIAELEELKSTIISDVITGKINIQNIEVPEYEYVDDEPDEEDDSEDVEEEIDNDAEEV